MLLSFPRALYLNSITRTAPVPTPKGTHAVSGASNILEPSSHCMHAVGNFLLCMQGQFTVLAKFDQVLLELYVFRFCLMHSVSSFDMATHAASARCTSPSSVLPLKVSPLTDSIASVLLCVCMA